MITIAKRITDSVDDKVAYISENDSRSTTLWKNLYEYVLLVLEIAIVMMKMTTAVVEAIVKLFVPPNEKQLSNEIILITGTGHGIGRELVLQLAAEGCKLICWDVDEAGNMETRQLLQQRGLEKNAYFYRCDVTKREDVLNLAETVQEKIGNVTIIINNAGIMCCKPFQQQTCEIIKKTFKVNVFAHFWVLEAFLPDMLAKNSGHIVSVCSMCGVIGLPYAAPYSASKFAIRGLIEALSEEFRINEATSNIKFTTVYPIMVNTGLAKKPKNRFPSLINILQPDFAASEIIKAMKREMFEITLPSHMFTFDRITRLFPRKAIQHAKDFLDTGVEPE